MTGAFIGRLLCRSIPPLRTRELPWGTFPKVTVPEFLHMNLWIVIVLMEVFMIGFLVLLEYFGL